MLPAPISPILMSRYCGCFCLVGRRPSFLSFSVAQASSETADTSQIELRNDDRSGCEDPGAVLVIGNPVDSPVCAHFRLDDSRDFPRTIAQMQENDPGLTIDVTQCQPPRYPHA